MQLKSGGRCAAVAMAAALACGGDGDGGSGDGNGDGGATGDGTGTNGTDGSGDDGSGDGEDGGGGGEPCGTFSPGDDFTVCAATYLSGPGDDRASAVAIAPDGTVVFAGTIAGDDLGQAPVELMGGGDGVVVRLRADGREVLSLTRIGGAVADVAVDSAGNLAVVGDFGVAVLTPNAASVSWTAALADVGAEVAVAPGGAVAALGGKTLATFDGAGQALGSVDVAATTINDVAIDDERAYATGFRQDDGYTCTQLQIPFIRAYDHAGAETWRAYDWTKEEVGDSGECADSRGMALALGGDGNLYYAGESHGGNTVHRKGPTDLGADANVMKFDAYNDPYNLNGAAPIAFYGRFDRTDGDLEVGQFLVTRLSDDKGNAARPRAIAADAAGNVVVAGGTACCIENGADKTVNGEPAMPEAYRGGGFVLIVSPDFDRRLSWTTFRGELGNGETGVSVAAAAGNMAVAIHQSLDDGATVDSPLLTFDAVQPDPGGGTSDGYLAVWPGP